jgi:hypothetical protein
MKQMNQRDAIHYIATQQEFKASALSGHAHTEGTGRLSDSLDRERFLQDVEGINYAVYSYGTPIAWYTEGNGWYVVEQKFSVTTSKHQNYVRRAIAESLEIAV